MSYLDHAIQHSRDSGALDVACNDNTTAVLSSKGQVHLSGIVKNKVQSCFEESNLDRYVDGRIVKVAMTEDRLFVLSETGRVFEHNVANAGCDTPLREVPLPRDCESDPVVDMATGRGHLLLLTRSKQVYGYGDNSEYQIVPGGDSRYDCAQPIYLGDFIKMKSCTDDSKCDRFVFEGSVNIATDPVKPVASCSTTACFASVGSSDYQSIKLGLYAKQQSRPKVKTVVPQDPVDEENPSTNGTYGFQEIKYTVTPILVQVNVTCVGNSVTVEGIMTLKATPKPGQEVCLFNFEEGGPIAPIPITGFYTVDPKDPLWGSLIPCTPIPFSYTGPKKGSCVSLSLTEIFGTDIPEIKWPSEVSLQPPFPPEDEPTGWYVCAEYGNVADGKPLVPYDPDHITINVSCPPCSPSPCETKGPVCITKIAAGFDVSVLVDDKGRIFTLGNLHSVRENEHLFNKTDLDNVLNQAGATIKFPADQLACKAGRNNDNCICREDAHDAKRFDLSKAEITLSPFLCVDSCKDDCDSCFDSSPVVKTNICKFISDLKLANESEVCENTCEPCDNTVYLKFKKCFKANMALVNEKSIRKVLAHFSDCITNADLQDLGKILSDSAYECVLFQKVVADKNTRVDYDNNAYCVDGVNYPIDQVLVLDFGASGSAFHVFNLDVCQGLRSIQFVCDKRCPNVTFNVPQSTTQGDGTKYCQSPLFFLTFSGVLSPHARTNLRAALGRFSYYNSPEYKRPISNRLFGTYLKGGDVVEIGAPCSSLVHQGTPDLPLVFCLNKRVLDVAVGDRSIHVVVNNTACPNEVLAIGNNCYGQLGFGNYFSTLCFKKVNRCLFDCQVNQVYAGEHVTAYVTASGKVYLTGELDSVVKTNKPTAYCNISADARVKDICIGKSSMIFRTGCYDLLGLGENQFGQLGTGSTCKVTSPKKLKFTGYCCTSVSAPCRPTPRWKCEKSCGSSTKKACCSSCADKKSAPSGKKTYTYPCKGTKTSLPPCTPCDTACSKPACKTPSGVSGSSGRKFRHPGMKTY